MRFSLHEQIERERERERVVARTGHNRSAFTLIELLVVIAIIAILAVVVVLTLNPAELLRQSRDSNRLTDMQTLTSALNLYNEDQGGTTGYSLGTPNVIYLSIPDPTATTTAGTNCSGLGLPVSSTTYHCPASSTYRNTNGTGWIPVKFASTTMGSPLSSLPVDPVNTTSSGEYYQYTTDGTNFEIAGIPESQKYSSASSSFTAGSSRTLITLGGTTTTYVVTAIGSGSWTVPAGVTSVQVELWGGGGAGAQYSNDSGGGAGAYVIETGLSVTPGNSITYIIAQGGQGVSGGSGYASGGNGFVALAGTGGGGGGSSAVSSTGWTYIASGGGGGGFNGHAQGASGSSGGSGSPGSAGSWATGGGGGSGTTGGPGTSSGAGAGGINGTPQTGTNGNGNYGGGGSSAGNATANGNNASGNTGGAGSGGAAGGTQPGNAGTNGSGSGSGGGGGGYYGVTNGGNGGQPGAGGGDAYSTYTPGNGGAGELIITYVH